MKRTGLVCAVGGALLGAMALKVGAEAQPGQDRSAAAAHERPRDVVPSNFARQPRPVHFSGGAPTAWGMEARRIDGHGNNVANPEWGRAGTILLRLSFADYADEISAPAGTDRPNPRTVSNIVASQLSLLPNATNMSDFMWQWGQFLDHDLDLMPAPESGGESFPIPVPMGDPHFDPMGTGTQSIPLMRSEYDPATGTGPENPREQFNILTAFIDASNVYGSDDVRAAALRANDGSGRLLTSAGDLLPYNTFGLPNAGGTSASLFLAGDIRANEQVGLTAMHTLWIREHNWWADQIKLAEPELSDEEVYQRARAIVGAEMQVITYTEFLPMLLGPDAIPPYSGYDPDVNATIATEFSSACYRLGHTMLSPVIRRTLPSGEAIPQGHLSLRDAFFANWRIPTEGGIDPVLRGLGSQLMQEIDNFVVDDVRNFLFGPPGSGGLDLISLNLQRAREHGLPPYNAVRVAMGLSPATTFADISSVPSLAAALQNAYGDVDKVDLWIGAICEDHLPGAKVGELLRAVLSNQFTRVRDGDRFWYQNFFTGTLLTEIQSTRLSDVIRRNTQIGSEINDNAFLVPASAGIPAASDWGLLCLALLLMIAGTFTMRFVTRMEPARG